MLSDILSFLSNKYGFLACIALPAMLVSIVILRDSVRAIKRDMSELMDQMEENDSTPSRDDTQEEESYKQMCDRIRAELMEEIKNSDTTEPTEPE